MAKFLVQAVLICLAYQSVVQAFPEGAPLNACANLNPSSHGASTATGKPPYQITFSSSSFKPQQTIKVTFSGIGNAQFKGFLIEGRIKDNAATDPSGFFKNPPSTAKIQCDSKTGNGVTHTNNTVKSSITFDWEAPSQTSGPVVFHYTVVRGGAPNNTMDPADYFMDVQSVALPPHEDIDVESKPLIFESENKLEEVIPVERVEVEVVGEEEYVCKYT